MSTPFKLLSILLVVGGGCLMLQLVGTKSQAEGLKISEEDYADGAKRFAAVKKKVKPGLEKALKEKKLKMGAPVFLRAFKKEKILEIWIKGDDEKFVNFRNYPIAAASGILGPKLREGDGQVPEGFYHVTPGKMRPNSDFHLAFNIGYPNKFDQAHDRTGTFIMVHGSNVSIGCLAMTDAGIEEIYTLCAAALKNGQPYFRVHLFPFRLNDENLAKHSENRWHSFWTNLQTGYQWFEKRKVPPNTIVKEGRYHFE